MAAELAPIEDTGLEELTSPGFTPDQIVHALVALALNGGNARRTARQLEDQGLKVSYETLRVWRQERFPRQYQRACTQHAPAIEAQVIHHTREAAVLAAHVEHKLLARLHENADQLDPKELGNALRNVTTSKGINVDKLLSLTGRPSSITEVRTVDTALDRLERLGFVNGTAEPDEGNPNNETENPEDADTAQYPASLSAPVPNAR